MSEYVLQCERYNAIIELCKRRSFANILDVSIMLPGMVTAINIKDIGLPMRKSPKLHGMAQGGRMMRYIIQAGGEP